MGSNKRCNGKDKETLVYLDFNDKLPHELLDDKLFIRIANLETRNPLIQVNDMVFKGTYGYSTGTNLYFKKGSHQGTNEFPFEKSTSFELEHIEAQNRILNCKQMRVPPTEASFPEKNERIQYNFKWNYEELLEKFENGTLDLKDMTEHKENKSPEKILPQNKENQEPSTNIEHDTYAETEMTEYAENIPKDADMDISEDPYQELKHDYNNLLMLAKRPVKRHNLTETVECDPKYQNSYDYKCIECKVLEPPLFSYFNGPKNIEKYDISECVDLNRCIKLEIIASSDNFPRILTDKEKKALLTVENFENLNLIARYLVLTSLMESLEQQVKTQSSEQNQQKDKFGHSPLETLDIFKKLICSLRKRIEEFFYSK